MGCSGDCALEQGLHREELFPAPSLALLLSLPSAQGRVTKPT